MMIEISLVFAYAVQFLHVAKMVKISKEGTFSSKFKKNGSVSKKIVLKQIYLFIILRTFFLSFVSFYLYFVPSFYFFCLFSFLIFSISFLFSSYSEFIQGLHQLNSEQTCICSLHTSCTFRIFYCRWMQLNHKNIKSFHPRSIMYTFSS